MSEPDVLDLKIRELKQLQSTAWRRIGRPHLTPSERREIRDQIKEIDRALRHHLAVMSVRLELETRAVENVSHPQMEFRILSAHLDPH